MAECFGANMDPDVVRFAKAQWGLSPLSSASALATAFGTYASVPQCVGPYATLPGIGTTRQVYACNATCQMATLCDDGDYMSLLMSQAGALIDFSVNATCIAHGGRLQCASYGATASTCARYACTFDAITGACKDQTACMTTCMLPMTAGGCALANGTWYMDQYNRNQCCPPDAYFNATNKAFPCSYAPPTAPALAYTITDPTCCAAQNGTWFVSGGYGACCFGKLKSIQNGNAVQLACMTTVSSWDVASCLSSCSRHSAGCTSCKAAQQSAGCCNTTTVVANETACLAPTICTNQLVAAANCADPTPFCAKCAGNVCSSVTQWPSCTLAVGSSNACASAGGNWDATAKVCNAIVNSTMVGTDCLRSDVCPSATDVGAFYAPFGVVPQYPRRAVTCQRGCYLPSVTTPATCTATANYKWLQDHANGHGICMTVTTAANCNTLGGTFLSASRTFFPGAFTTSAMCAEGNCVGSPRVDGWSAAQCTSSSSWASCTMACSTCAVPTSSPLAAQGSAACFSTDASYCTSLGYSSTPCMDMSANSTTACAALTSATWRTCSSYASATTCVNTTDVYATMLGCRWTSGPCTDAVSCASQGSCNDGPDGRRKVCLDAGWTYGDTCKAKITTGLNQVSVATCSQCQTTVGVCVAPASGSGCATPEKVHPRGCRVDGIATAAACATAGGSWVTPATTQSACVSTLGCLEPGATTLSMKNATQCTKCGGSLKPWYTWTSGVWAPAYVEAYTWQAGGTTLVSANAYKPTLSLQLLGQVLQGPIAKRVARLQKTKALLQYNGMTDVLSKLACACGRSANSACFSTPASANATLTSQSQIFCGNSSTSIPTGTTSALVTLTCPSSLSARRRLDAASDGSAQLSVSTYSIASYTLALAPYCTSQALNPLVLKTPGGLVYGQLLGPGQGHRPDGAAVAGL
ncbi:hypothetical protein SDRG_08456 [Saprolegnia diclina VS20]|uniref:Uncharacterized protein n=1 Tax=Saprolegnia diclina (strain VS20) TaxID=1156394 RepID=T0Q8M1_SAPDV|nr:hypothetical protein SDRG_08456 [Saprolegnia diclina VS20]EQC34254.1 hypothetical protein SDRG_08456 [Saprolegnia diclina VS20]|eukprot:XP_008612566.1 hypothetical protein SDRG_08456 [Saprolegnia diclina VS20]